MISKAFVLSPFKFGLIDRTIIWLFDEESVGIIIVDRVYPINMKPVLSQISYVIYQALKLSFKKK